MRQLVLLTVASALSASLACSPASDANSNRGTPAPESASGAARRSRPSALGDATSTDHAGLPRIVILGDSLTAGLGLPVQQSYPSLIQERLDREGYEYEVVNAGVSGDTSAGGLRRLEWALDGDPAILIVALGGNDGLRGLPVAELRKNLTAIIERAQARGLTVILAGMEAPPNNGPEYTAGFRRVYADLAARYDIALVPFLLEGVAGDGAFNQSDGIHPNARGARLVADTVWRALEPALSRSTRDSR